MTSRQRRKTNRAELLEARSESRAAKRSKYGAKKFEKEHGRPPDPQAEAKAKVRTRTKQT
jgi:hypothetical protein